MRPIYVRLLQLHPSGFRNRFAGEMLDIFDDCGQPPALVLDAALSLVRQWTVRAPVRQALQARSVEGDSGLYINVSETPRPASLMLGALLAVVFFFAMSYLNTHGGKRASLIIGSHHPSPSHMLPAATRAEAESLTTETRMKPYPDQPQLPAYFQMILVLAALDTDRNGVISAAEIERAPAVLARLDANHDGHLDAAECGARGIDSQRPSGIQAFMRIHPVLAALDTNHDGFISSDEIRNASASLRTLDRNHDGNLSEVEVYPDAFFAKVISIMATLDADGDKKLSRQELVGPVADRFRGVLDHADRDHDGFITESELAAEFLRSSPPVH